jgi:hypothetical protein
MLVMSFVRMENITLNPNSKIAVNVYGWDLSSLREETFCPVVLIKTIRLFLEIFFKIIFKIFGKMKKPINSDKISFRTENNLKCVEIALNPNFPKKISQKQLNTIFSNA